MALKKSELYSSLWASCDELRGGTNTKTESRNFKQGKMQELLTRKTRLV